MLQVVDAHAVFHEQLQGDFGAWGNLPVDDREGSNVQQILKRLRKKSSLLLVQVGRVDFADLLVRDGLPGAS